MTMFAFGRGFCAVFLRTAWRLRVIGAEHVPLTGPLIVAGNHVSYFDPPALGVALPRPIHYMAKSELFRIPVLGPLIASLNAYPVDRNRGDVTAIKRSVEILRRGEAVGMFPEGTRNRSGTLRPRIGVALLARITGAAVLPAYIEGTSDVRRFRRITVVLGEPFSFAEWAAGRPVEPTENARREQLSKYVDELMDRIFALRARI